MDRQTEQWLRYAKDDQESAVILAASGKLEAACYHFQQSGEKYLKAIQIHTNSGVAKTHLLTRVCEQIESLGIFVPDQIKDSSMILEAYATTTRYPGYSVTQEDLNICMTSQNAIKSFVEKYFLDRDPVRDWQRP